MIYIYISYANCRVLIMLKIFFQVNCGKVASLESDTKDWNSNSRCQTQKYLLLPHNMNLRSKICFILSYHLNLGSNDLLSSNSI